MTVVCLTVTWEWHVSWSNIDNYLVKKCSQKVDLRVQFVTLLKVFACMWVRVCAITHLKGPDCCWREVIGGGSSSQSRY